MKTNWIQTGNLFEKATKKSRKNFSTLIENHTAGLEKASDDRDIKKLYKRTSNIKKTYNRRYGEWQQADTVYRGQSNRLAKLLSELSTTKIRQWEKQIKVLYPANSDDFKHLLPNGKKPFQSGKTEQRFAALQQLAQQLKRYNDLQPVASEVKSYYERLLDTRKKSERHQQDAEGKKERLEMATEEAVKTMRYNFEHLKTKYNDNMAQLEQFFDASLLKNQVSKRRNVRT